MEKLKKFWKQTSRRVSWALYRKNMILRKKIDDLVVDGCKLHIGCGLNKLQGYINIDIIPLEGCDVVMDAANDLNLIPSNIAVEIRMENVFEHFYRDQQPEILKECYRILKKNGELIIRGLPNFDALIEAYLKKEKGLIGPEFDLFNVYRFLYGEPEQGDNIVSQLHKDIFTAASVRNLLKDAGFQIYNIEKQRYSNEINSLCFAVSAVK
jgi:predicted SAM-dependent methyltransferase